MFSLSEDEIYIPEGNGLLNPPTLQYCCMVNYMLSLVFLSLICRIVGHTHIIILTVIVKTLSLHHLLSKKGHYRTHVSSKACQPRLSLVVARYNFWYCHHLHKTCESIRKSHDIKKANHELLKSHYNPRPTHS